LTLETVLVALFTEGVGQRVPDRRTSNRKGPTAECRPSVARYVHGMHALTLNMGEKKCRYEPLSFALPPSLIPLFNRYPL